MRSASLGAGARMPLRPPGCSTPTLDSKRPGAAVLRDGRVGRHGAQEPEGLGGHRWTRWCGGGALHAAATVVAAAPPTEPAPPRVVPQREAVRADCFCLLPPTFERGVSAASFTLGFVGSSLVAFLCARRPSRRSFPLNNRKFCPNFKSPKPLFLRTARSARRRRPVFTAEQHAAATSAGVPNEPGASAHVTAARRRHRRGRGAPSRHREQAPSPQWAVVARCAVLAA